jgi:hypothetical protein
MSRYAEGGTEPSLEEMLGDPVVQAVMERDGVTRERVRETMAFVKTSSRARAERERALQ